MVQATTKINTPQLKLIYLIDYQAMGLCWRRDTRLRVMEHLCGMPYGSIKTSHQLDPQCILDVLNALFPGHINDEYMPPEKSRKQIRVLCEYYSSQLVDEKGLPPTLPNVVQV